MIDVKTSSVSVHLDPSRQRRGPPCPAPLRFARRARSSRADAGACGSCAWSAAARGGHRVSERAALTMELSHDRSGRSARRMSECRRCSCTARRFPPLSRRSSTPHEWRNACGWISGTPARAPIALVIFQRRCPFIRASVTRPPFVLKRETKSGSVAATLARSVAR